MTTQQLLQIHPRELKFICELKKPSSCAIRLTNNTFHNVAFKVKTTSPKKYCVRPNIGIIMPKSSCEFTVTMQAQKVAPPDMACKDKFLIQGTVVPVGTTDKDITPNTFSKDNGNYVEEAKLRVALMSPPESPGLSPVNGVHKQGPFFEDSVLEDPLLRKVEIPTPLPKFTKDVIFKMTNGLEFKTEKDVELRPIKEVLDVHPSKTSHDSELTPVMVVTNDEQLKPAKDEKLKPEKAAINDQLAKPVKDEKLRPEKDIINDELPKPSKEEESKPEKGTISDELPKLAKDIEFPSKKDKDYLTVNAVEDLKLVSGIEELKTKLKVLESKVNEADCTISKLTEERRSSIQERKILQEELVVLRSRTTLKKVHAGFPLLFVVMVALVSMVLGYASHP